MTTFDLRRGRRHFRLGWTIFWRQVRVVIRNPIFAVLTVMGNSMVFACAGLFYLTERGHNASVRNFGDALWWAFATITTVGYGDTVPISPGGRIVAVVLILTGGVLFLAFVALLSSAFVEREFHELEHELLLLKRKLSSVEQASSETVVTERHRLACFRGRNSDDG